MKLVKYIIIFSISLLLFSCSEDMMDEINAERNGTITMDAKNILPDAIVKTFYETTSTDLAWYATVYVEHSAGTWGQSADADRRIGQESSSLVNNSWNNIYDVLTICKTLLNKTDPVVGEEPDNYWVRGVAYVLTAYNLSVATDSWGEIPWTDACLGTENLKPAYENQSVIYGYIQSYLDSAIVNLNKSTIIFADKDLIYGSTATTLAANKAAWVRVAHSLKARYYMRLSQRNGTTSYTNAIAAAGNGFTSNAQGFIFNRYDINLASNANKNPWWEFRLRRGHLSVGSTLYNLMAARNDTRRPVYFTQISGSYVPAPVGTADEAQTGTYSRSIFTEGNTTAKTTPSPMMTYYELKFIEAEARFRNGDVTYTTPLQQAVEASFVSKGLALGVGTAYYTAQVATRLTLGNELNEIMTQKYIALYEAEALEAYNDYRRTGIPTMMNPNNTTQGFVNRYPFALSEESSNSANVPSVSIYTEKVWWAGGTEKL